MSKPITPDEAMAAKAVSIPAEVYEAFNECIVENLRGGTANFRLDTVAKLAAQKLGTSTQILFDRRWCDVEPAYRAAGWDVEYDSPGYNESYPATFTFTRRR